MSTFNVVRFRVKPGQEDRFLDAHRDGKANWPGLLHGAMIKTGDRVRVSCAKERSGRLIAELTIGLAGPDGSLAAMTKAAGATDPGCPSGVVEGAGTK